MNMMLRKPARSPSPQSQLLSDIQDQYPELLAGAVEYAFQRNDISAGEYRQWQNRITEFERQRTMSLLASIKA